MRLHFSFVAGLVLVVSALSTTPLRAQQERVSPPKPLDLETYRNRAFDAYTQALTEGKYTLLLFSYHHDVNGFARRMEKNLRDPSLAIYSPHFVAAIIEKEDEGGEMMRKVFNIERLPTVIVLRTDPDRFLIVGRMEGVFDPKEIDTVLRESLRIDDSPESRPDPAPEGGEDSAG